MAKSDNVIINSLTTLLIYLCVIWIAYKETFIELKYRKILFNYSTKLKEHRFLTSNCNKMIFDDTDMAKSSWTHLVFHSVCILMEWSQFSNSSVGQLTLCILCKWNVFSCTLNLCINCNYLVLYNPEACHPLNSLT